MTDETGFYHDTDIETVEIEMEPGLRMSVDQMIHTLTEAREEFPEHPVVANVETWTQVKGDGLWREMWKIDFTVSSGED